MKILMLGDIYAEPGRKAVTKWLPKVIAQEKLDFVIANGENVTHGKSITFVHYQELKKAGVDVITSGNHIFKQKAVLEYIKKTPDLLRPLNMNGFLPGKGYYIVEKNKKKICVLNLIGNSFMDKSNSFYEAMDRFLSLKLKYDILMIDFHAEATAEKAAFAWNYDGLITGFAGTHTHVQTADERILPKGTGFITDLGMCGVINSIIGANPEEVIYKEKTGLPTQFRPATGQTQICGAVFDIDNQTNRVKSIQRLMIKPGE